MLAICLMLLVTYYALNYAGIINRSRMLVVSEAHRILWTRECVTPYTTNTTGKFKHGVRCCYVYNWLCHSYAQQGYTEWAVTPLSCVEVAKLLRFEDHRVEGKAWNSNFVWLATILLSLCYYSSVVPLNFISIASLCRSRNVTYSSMYLYIIS